MAADINSVVIVGRLTRDCELKSLTNFSVCNFSIAANRRVKSQDGTWRDEVSYFDVELFGKLSEALQQYLKKGAQIAVSGELRQNRWEQDGQKRSRVTIRANNVQLLGSKNTASSSESDYSGGNASSEQRDDSAGKGGEENFEDDIPF